MRRFGKLNKKGFIFFALSIILCAAMLTGCPSGRGGQAVDNYEKGVLTETSFRSAFLGFEFTIPDDSYIMATEAQMAEMVQLGADTLHQDDEEDFLDYAQRNGVYEMMVSSIIGSPNIMVIIEKLPSSSSITDEQYIDALKAQIKEPIVSMGFDMVFSATSAAIIGGQSLTMIPVEVPGIALQDYYLKRYNNRMAVIIVSYTEDTRLEMETLLGAFKAI